MKGKCNFAKKVWKVKKTGTIVKNLIRKHCYSYFLNEKKISIIKEVKAFGSNEWFYNLYGWHNNIQKPVQNKNITIKRLNFFWQVLT